MLFSVIICRIWSFATAINKLLFDKNYHICNSYQKGAIFYQSHKVFYTTYEGMTAMYYFQFIPIFICYYTFEWVLFHSRLTSDNLDLSLTSNTTFSNSFLENVVLSFCAIIIIKSITLYISRL